MPVPAERHGKARGSRGPPPDPGRTTPSGTPIQPLYGPRDFAGSEYRSRLGDPGEFPYTRGIYATMYRGRLWTMRQYGGYASAEESNQRYRRLLGQGQTGLSIAFDLPTQLGYDADHPATEGEVGRVGVSICALDDMERLVAGIPLDRVSTSMTINATAPILLAFYVAAARRQGVPDGRVAGTTQNDILKEFIARGTYIYPPQPSLRLVADVIAYCAQCLPRWNPISISGYHMREAGATAVQELAFTFANAVTYVDTVRGRGLDVDAFAPQLSFFLACHNYFFEEIAKFRAARRIWARLVAQRFGARDPRSLLLRFHTQTAGSTLTAQQPQNNVVRVAVQALAAVLGGTQSLHCNALDEALALPTEDTAQLALRTQQIIALETGVPDAADPLGGSYYVERLTDQIQERVEAYLDRIDQLGGGLAALESGFLEREIAESAYREQVEIETGRRVVVGVNRFPSGDDGDSRPAATLRVDEAVRERRCRELAAHRSRRDPGRVRESLAVLYDAAAGDDNVMPPLVECALAGATLGEMADTLRNVFGEQRSRT